MNRFNRHLHLGRRADQGYTLIVGLLLLIVLTLFGLGMFRSLGLQDRIAANTRDKQRAFEAAQSALQYGEWWLGQSSSLSATTCSGVTSANVSSGMRVCSQTLSSLTTPTSLPWSVRSDYLPPSMTANGGGGLASSGDVNYAAKPGLYISYLGLSANGLAALYQVTAFGYGGDATTGSVVQSTYQIASSAKDLGQQ
ncbi:pilus assembly protein [Ralstonia solanacearum]|uniref:Pilus assembly protein PilX n=1 Tax=Ralstonia solanacearum K60 TaxID=1091042 RepID=A0AAP7ZIT1_RALSL|nr:pilus assembly protein [Ralstonia solanacearum]MBT1540116.1 pilus assembly protein [Ralstonia solanacearum]OYQ09884.1 pilus assembly protein PilX [Ralstonia solanacearum K60]QOK84898.1 pilus assembly protein [Ralstonia solanacearum]RIJ84046.1 pilus assembly protein PilX [Ralstonia solanacearum]